MTRISAATAFAATLVAIVAMGGPAQARSASAAAPTSADNCPNAGEMVSDTAAADLRRSVRCLILAERAARGLPKLIRSDALDTAAKRHVRTMIEADCLLHKCPGEVDLERRLRRAGYFEGATSYRFAESIGCGTTPQSMVASWLGTLFDRTNILEPDFRDFGIAVSQESSADPCDDGFGTFTIVFGSRTLKR